MKLFLISSFLFLLSNLALAESIQYVVTGHSKDKVVTGFVSSYSNGTVAGSIDGKYCSGNVSGLGMVSVTDSSGTIYELDIVR